MDRRVSWLEIRRNEIPGYGSPYYVIADLIDDVWKFADRESGEIRWFHLDSTPELVKKANELLASEDSPSSKSIGPVNQG